MANKRVSLFSLCRINKTLFFLIMLLSFQDFRKVDAQQVPAAYVFGDSLVDVGNNNHLKLSLLKANFPHNGVDYPTHKPTGRFSNGKNAADFLAEKIGIPTPPPYLSLVSRFNFNRKNDTSFLSGVSFASGGAGIFNSTSRLFRETIPLAKQVDYFGKVHEALLKQLGPIALQRHLSKSLFGIVIGSNDIFGYFGSSDIRKNSTPQQYVDSMLVTLKGQMQRLYNFGARKFLVVGVGATGCCPSERLKNGTECNQETNFWSLKYNEGLKSMLQGLKSQFRDINFSYFDTYNILNNIIQKPTTYGFTEVKAACCGLGDLRAKVPCLPIAAVCSNRRQHVFWDLYHPTEATASIMVENIFNGPSQYAFPMNVKQLVAV